MMAVVAGFGNPLLDVTIKVKDDALLKKYNLNEDDQIEFNEAKMKSLNEDIKNIPSESTPGGCAQNTLRVFQWLSDTSEYCTYMIGSIGNDEQGKALKRMVEDEGVKTLYATNKHRKTGGSVAIIKNENRSLVAYIGAAETFTINNFHQVTENGKLLEPADLFYMEGFFITKRHEVATYLLQYAHNKNKLFVFNISGPYVVHENLEIVKQLIENCDILFGNSKEFQALIEETDPSISIEDYAVNLSKINPNKKFRFGKMVVVTNGGHNVTCIHSNGVKTVCEVPKIPPESIKDTTGAGDAFTAGFLMGVFKNYQPELCMKYGCFVARQIIQQVGCKLPEYLPEFQVE